MTATGKKGNMRLISVVMNEDNTDNRTKDTLAMLDYGFSMYSIDRVISKDMELGKIRINMADDEYTLIKAMENIDILNNNQKDKRKITYNIDTYSINAPVKQGDIIGKITVYEDGKYLKSENITVMDNVSKASILKIFGRNLRDIFGLSM